MSIETDYDPAPFVSLLRSQGYSEQEIYDLTERPQIIGPEGFKDPEERRLAELGLAHRAAAHHSCGSKRYVRCPNGHVWSIMCMSCGGRFSTCCGMYKEREFAERIVNLWSAVTSEGSTLYYLEASSPLVLDRDEIMRDNAHIRAQVKESLAHLGQDGAVMKTVPRGDQKISKAFVWGRAGQAQAIREMMLQHSERITIREIKTHSTWHKYLEKMASTEIPKDPKLRAEYEAAFYRVRLTQTLGELPEGMEGLITEDSPEATVNHHYDICETCHLRAIETAGWLRVGQHPDSLSPQQWEKYQPPS